MPSRCLNSPMPKHRLLRISVQIQSIENVLSSQWAISTKAKMPCYFLTLAKAAARRAAKVASAFLALSMAGRGFGIPVTLVVLTPAQCRTIIHSFNQSIIHETHFPSAVIYAQHFHVLIIGTWCSMQTLSALMATAFVGLDCMSAVQNTACW